MKSDYFVRKENRIERFKELAAKNEQLSISSYETAKKIGSFIPMGQPILVGHHSEGRHRRDLAKIDNAMRKSVEATQKAGYYEDRVNSAESNNVISSDNPDAIQLLEQKLVGLQLAQELWKTTNKIIKNKNGNKVEKLMKLAGMKQETAEKLLTPDFAGRIGIPSYKLTNNNANMARIKQRIEQLKKIEAMEDKEVLIGEVRILSSSETNRTQIFFPGKPSEEVRTELKSNGFRWSPMESAWQRNLSNHAQYLAESIVNRFYK